jgi:integrase
MEPTRTPETDAAYLFAGKRHLRRAKAARPDLTDLDDLLIALVEDDLSVLKPSTSRLYKAELLSVLRWAVAEGKLSQAASTAAAERIARALFGRRGTPERRLASKKVRDAREDEITKVLHHLIHTSRGRTSDQMAVDGILPLWLIVAPRVGLRPIEWTTARVEGKFVVVQCAKATNGRGAAKVRRVDLSAMEKRVREGTAVFCRAFPAALARHEGDWKAFRKVLAERLARACQTCGVRRLSLYTFRHVALSTWKAAGLDKEVVAALAGHASTETAVQYAPGKAGWKNQSLPKPESALVRRIAEANGIAGDPDFGADDDVSADAASYDYDYTPEAELNPDIDGEELDWRHDLEDYAADEPDVPEE